MGTSQASTLEIAERDGRRLRAINSRGRVVAALLELVREGDMAPTAERVAVRAKVGLRTVFRHFKDTDGLYSEMAGAILTELSGTMNAPIPGDTWREKILASVRRRTVIFEAITPFRRASDSYRHNSVFLTQAHALMTDLTRIGVEDIVPPEVRMAVPLFDTLDLLLSYEVWSRLRQEQNLGVEEAIRVITAALKGAMGVTEL